MAMILESTDRSQRFPLDRESIFVGSSEWKSDICLTGSGIADVHCELTPAAHGVRVVALAEGRVTVNGTPVREGMLLSGDELGIAALRFRVASDEKIDHPEPVTSNVEMPVIGPVHPELCRWIVSMSGMNLGPLDWDELQTMIGRGEVRLDDEVQRENESTWQRIRDVLPRSGSEGLLCDDLSNEAESVQPTRSRTRQRTRAADSTVSDLSAQPVDQSGSDEILTAAPRRREVPLAPQFFIMRGHDEVGPLPRQAIQELADEGKILADTPVRLEESDEWSTAAAVGLHCSAVKTPGQTAEVDSASVDRTVAGGFAWLIFAPYYLITGLARPIASLDPRRAVLWGAVILVTGTFVWSWFQSWSQTAMRGIVTLDGQPIGDVLVQLTGAQTGDSAMGVSGSDGRFRVVTLDGELKPGLYLVTVRPLSEVSGSSLTSVNSLPDVEFPDRYRHLNTTDAAIEITADQAQYSVALTTHPQSESSGFRGGAVPATRVLP